MIADWILTWKTDTQIYVEFILSSFKNNQVRDLLIGTIADVYEAATNLEGNCWGINSVNVCHAPRQVTAFTEGLIFPAHSARPTILTHWCADSYMSVVVLGDGSVDNWFHCCETRGYVDAKLQRMQIELKSVYPASRSMDRLVECTEQCP
jgi:hypothetical protein